MARLPTMPSEKKKKVWILSMPVEKLFTNKQQDGHSDRLCLNNKLTRLLKPPRLPIYILNCNTNINTQILPAFLLKLTG